jgi:hypothetical protein
MKSSKILTLQLILLVAGTVGWVWKGKSLQESGTLDHEPNLLHLKRSPFGRTLALAMRGPVDVYWHRGAVHEHGHDDHDGPCGPECEHDHGPECEEGCEHDHLAQKNAGHICDFQCEHDHEHGPECEVGCEHDDDHAEPAVSAKQFAGIRPFILDHIEGMRRSYYTRTNTSTDSKRHRAYIMGETQKRLKISYEMDPSNLSGYGAYFLFLSEALARVEGEETEPGAISMQRRAAHTLAHATLDYCLKHRDEAPAMITAATAAHDCVQILLNYPEPDMTLARDYLRLLDGSLYEYESLRAGMIQSGTWERFPLSRRAEMEKTHSLVRVLHRVDHELFGKLSESTPESSVPPSL